MAFWHAKFGRGVVLEFSEAATEEILLGLAGLSVVGDLPRVAV